MILREELIEIGCFNKPHGVAGELSVTVDVDADVLRELSCIVSDVDGIFVPFFINSCRTKTSQTVLLTIDGIGSDTEAARLVNHNIYALKRDFSQLMEEEEMDDEYPLDFFIGFQLITKDGTKVGEIIDVDDQTENAIFIVDNDGSEVLVPASDDLIDDINVDSKVIIADLPAGLLELNT